MTDQKRFANANRNLQDGDQQARKRQRYHADKDSNNNSSNSHSAVDEKENSNISHINHASGSGAAPNGKHGRRRSLSMTKLSANSTTGAVASSPPLAMESLGSTTSTLSNDAEGTTAAALDKNMIIDDKSSTDVETKGSACAPDELMQIVNAIKQFGTGASKSSAHSSSSQLIGTVDERVVIGDRNDICHRNNIDPSIVDLCRAAIVATNTQNMQAHFLDSNGDKVVNPFCNLKAGEAEIIKNGDGKTASAGELNFDASESSPKDESLNSNSSIECPEGAVELLQRLHDFVVQNPFDPYSWESNWEVSDSILNVLKEFVELVLFDECLEVGVKIIIAMTQQRYFHSVTPRRKAVHLGLWMPLVKLFSTRRIGDKLCARALHAFTSLSDHVILQDVRRFSGAETVQKFWDVRVHLVVFLHNAHSILVLPETFSANQYEMHLINTTSVLRMISKLIAVWSIGQDRVFWDLTVLIEFCRVLCEKMNSWDKKFGEKIAPSVRGQPLEELVKIAGVLVLEKTELVEYATTLSAQTEERNVVQKQNLKTNMANVLPRIAEQSQKLVKFIFAMLTLRVPCFWKKDNRWTPFEERQMEFESSLAQLIESSTQIPELCSAFGLEKERTSVENTHMDDTVFTNFFTSLKDMADVEAKYRFEMVTPIIPMFIAKFEPALQKGSIPETLNDFRSVLNKVSCEDAGFIIDHCPSILFYPCLLEFETKRACILADCDSVRVDSVDFEDPLTLVVSRDEVLEGVCAPLKVPRFGEMNDEYDSEGLNRSLEVEYKGDEGEDQGGLRRQWIDRACRYIVSSDLFYDPVLEAQHLGDTSKVSHFDRKNCVGNIFLPASRENIKQVPDWGTHMELFGMIVGFAILHGDTIPVRVGSSFWAAVLEHPCFPIFHDEFMEAGQETKNKAIELVADSDKVLATKIDYLATKSFASAGESIEEAIETCGFESYRESYLKYREAAFKHINSDVQEALSSPGFISFVVADQLQSLENAARLVRFGMTRVLGRDLFMRIKTLMHWKQFDTLISGQIKVDVNDWRLNSVTDNGYTMNCQPVQWFWQIVEEMSDAERTLLLLFTTGCSNIPHGGFRYLQPEKFTIQKVNGTDRMPEAHTCANMLDLPPYTSKATLKEKLLFAISNVGDTFGRV